MKAAVIVAHPDDEVIWAGGIILRHRDWDWTVLALCRADDPDRAPRFRGVCARLGARNIISDLDDGSPLARINAEAEIGGRVMENLGSTTWDLCLTHGANGEYGHRRHRQTSRVVRRLVARGRLRCRGFWTFAYDCDAATGTCRPARRADIFLELSLDELREKRRLVCEDYGFSQSSFEARACVSPECFTRHKDTHAELAP